MRVDSAEKRDLAQQRVTNSSFSKRPTQKSPLKENPAKLSQSKAKLHASSTKLKGQRKQISKEGARTRVKSPRTVKPTSVESKSQKVVSKKDNHKTGITTKPSSTKLQQSKRENLSPNIKASTPTKQSSEASFLYNLDQTNPKIPGNADVKSSSKCPSDDSWISEVRDSRKEERVMLPIEKIRSGFPDEVHDDLEEDEEEGDIDLGPELASRASTGDDHSEKTRPVGNRSESQRSNMTSEDRDARDITRKMITDILRDTNDELSFEFGGNDVAVSYGPSVTYETASLALKSSPFLQWQAKISRVVGPKRIEVRHVDIQSVDFMDSGDVIDSIKIDSHCVLIDEEHDGAEEEISGTCFLRDTRVGLLIELSCVDDGSSWSLLVDQPRIPIGAVSALELPVGIMDDDEEKLYGFVIEEIEEACGLSINMSDLVDLSQQAYSQISIENVKGLCPSPSQSGEHVRVMYMKHEISKDHLLRMRARFSEQREQGITVTMRVVPTQDLWKVTSDMKVICALFLLDKVHSNLSDDQMLLNRRRRKIADGEDVGVCDNVSLRSAGLMTNVMTSMMSISEISELSESSGASERAKLGNMRSKLLSAEGRREAKDRGKKLVSGLMSSLKESMAALDS